MLRSFQNDIQGLLPVPIIPNVNWFIKIWNILFNHLAMDRFCIRDTYFLTALFRSIFRITIEIRAIFDFLALHSHNDQAECRM